MQYHLNYNFIWRYADRLGWGLVLSLELAAVAIAIGSVIGLALAVVSHGARRPVRVLVGAYVEVFRNVPLLLLVYLVFYGIPSVGGFAYDATTSFTATLAVFAGAHLVEVFRAGLGAIPKGLIDAGRGIGLTPWQLVVHVRLPTMFRIVLPSLGARLELFGAFGGSAGITNQGLTTVINNGSIGTTAVSTASTKSASPLLSPPLLIKPILPL